MSDNLILLSEWSKSRSDAYRNTSNARTAILAGRLPGAKKIGRDWFVPADAQLIDKRRREVKPAAPRR